MTDRWPNGRRFAFTIFDDTDWATVERVGPVYDLLADLGMRTTKSAWVRAGAGPGLNAGSTCEDPAYLDWLLALQRRGFEIGLHNASPATSRREETRAALERFRALFGQRMIVHCNHVGCEDGIYGGDDRLSGWRRAAYNVVTRGRRRRSMRGHVDGDALFWGDLCRQHVNYVRNFVFQELNALAVCPEMPYHDPGKPFVNFWFVSADGATLPIFLRNFSRERIDRLAEAGGACIAYVHFADRFARDGRPHPEFRRTMEYVASLGGWFAPVSELLDHLRAGASPAERTIDAARLGRLEERWLADRMAAGLARLPRRSLGRIARVARRRA
jgi:hypothetical protein